jgi:hypothetical protein
LGSIVSMVCNGTSLVKRDLGRIVPNNLYFVYFVSNYSMLETINNSVLY